MWAAAGFQPTEDTFNFHVPLASFPDFISPAPAERRESKPTLTRHQSETGECQREQCGVRGADSNPVVARMRSKDTFVVATITELW